MRCLAVCQDELVIRMLDEILLPGFDVEFIVESKPAARRLHDAGVHVVAGDPRRTETYVKADLTPGTCVIIEDNGRRSLKKILEAVRDAGGTLVYVLGVGVGAQTTAKRVEEFHAEFPDVVYLSMAELFGGPLLTEFSRSLTRARVLQYQRYFSDADRVLILLHNDPDPDAMASGLALRNVLHRTQDDGHHRRHPGRDAAGEPADAEPARHPRRGGDAGVGQGVRPRRDGGRPAALFRRPHRSRGPRHRPSSRAAGLHGGLQGHPRRLRVDVHHPHRAPPRRGHQHLGAHGDGDALRDQVGHAVLQPADQPRRHRGLLVPVSARRRRPDPEDGRRGNHHRTARTTSSKRTQAARSSSRCSARSWDRPSARTSSRTSRTSSCS